MQGGTTAPFPVSFQLVIILVSSSSKFLRVVLACKTFEVRLSVTASVLIVAFGYFGPLKHSWDF